MPMYQKQKRAKVQKMTKKYSKLWNNRLIMQLYTLFCIKNKKYKLIFFKDSNIWELFDLEADSKEKNNLINENLECVEELKEKLSEWMSR